jgi:hypothetical protein
MPNDHDQSLAVSFRRNDGLRERIRLPHSTLADAVMGIQRVFYMSDGLYTKADIYRGNELVETMENHSSVRVASILIQ